MEFVDVYCEVCGERISLNPETEGKEWMKKTVYGNPFDNIQEEVYLHKTCEDLFYGGAYSDFGYKECDFCHRLIIQRNPHNGFHDFFRNLDESLVCLACYEKELIAGNVDVFEEDTIKGMFFNDGDLEEKGFECQGTFFINSRGVQKYIQKGKTFLDAGYIVINEYVRLSTFGEEGTVRMWTKLK